MALSFVEYPGDGSTTQYTFSFEYIASDYIKVYAYDPSVKATPTATDEVAFTLVNSGTVELEAAATGVQTLRIARITAKTKLHKFSDDASLKAGALNEQVDQVLHIAVEATDLATDEAELAAFAWAGAVVAQTAAEVAEANAETSASSTATAAAAAGTAETNAASSAAEAAAALAAANLPAVGAGDAGKLLKVNTGETGYEHLSATPLGLTMLQMVDAVAGRTALGVYSASEADAAIAAGVIIPLGYRKGLDPASSSASGITVSPGVIEINGILYAVTTALTKTGLTGLSNNTWYPILVTAPAEGTAISASDVWLDATMPLKDGAKNGWYNVSGTGRMIGFLLTDGSGNILGFSMHDGMYRPNDQIVFRDVGPAGNSATGALLSVAGPALGVRLDVEIHAVTTGAGGNASKLFLGDGNQVSPSAEFNLMDSTNWADGQAVYRGWLNTNISGEIYYWTSSSSYCYLRMQLCGIRFHC